MLYKNPLSR